MKDTGAVRKWEKDRTFVVRIASHGKRLVSEGEFSRRTSLDTQNLRRAPIFAAYHRLEYPVRVRGVLHAHVLRLAAAHIGAEGDNGGLGLLLDAHARHGQVLRFGPLDK